MIENRGCERPSARVYNEPVCEPPNFNGVAGSKLQELEKNICCLQEEINHLRCNLSQVLNPRHNMPETEKECVKSPEESAMSNYISAQNRLIVRLIDDVRSLNIYLEV